MICPECGVDVPAGEPACPICGFAFNREAAAQADAATAYLPRRIVRPKLRITRLPKAAPATVAKPAKPRAPAKRNMGWIKAAFCAFGRDIASIPHSLDGALVWLLHYEWDFLPSGWNHFAGGVGNAFASVGRLLGGWILSSVWSAVRLAFYLVLLAVKLVTVVAVIALMIILGIVAIAA